MKYITVSVPVNETQVISMMKTHSISAISAIEKIAKQNMKGELGKINTSSLNEVALAITQEGFSKTPEVISHSLQKFITDYIPLSLSKYNLEEEVTREDRILHYYTVGTKRDATKLLEESGIKTKVNFHLWIIMVESIDNDVVVKVMPYKESNTVLTKYQDLQGYVVTLASHDNADIIVTILT